MNDVAPEVCRCCCYCCILAVRRQCRSAKLASSGRVGRGSRGARRPCLRSDSGASRDLRRAAAALINTQNRVYNGRVVAAIMKVYTIIVAIVLCPVIIIRCARPSA